MSRIGKKPIPLPKGVTYVVEGNTVRVKGPKGEVVTHLPGGVKFEQNDGILTVTRDDDSKAAIHGLVRALVNNSVEGRDHVQGSGPMGAVTADSYAVYDKGATVVFRGHVHSTIKHR